MMHSVLVTGANRGIGLEFVKQLVAKKKPKYVFAGCRNLAKAEVLKQLAAKHAAIKVIKLDVTDDSSIDSAVAEVATSVGDEGLGVLINNAGIYNTEPLQRVTRDMMQEFFSVNCTSPLIITQKFLPLLKKRSALTSLPGNLNCNNAVISLTSGYASITENTYGGLYAYRASKAALSMVTKSLSIDLRQDNILVVTIHPGWVQTDMGGPSAPVTAEESVSAMMEVIDRLGERENGGLIKYSGNIHSF